MARVLVLGSNRGIGLELCRQLSARGDTVVATCRRTTPELGALGVEVHEGVDLTQRTTLDALAERLPEQSLDALLVVAGVLKGVSLEGLDAQVIRDLFEVNALGPLSAVHALRRCLRKGESGRTGAKVGLITSRMGSIEDNTSGGSYAYRMSKAALNMAGRSLAHDLSPQGIAVQLMHPGWVRTEMTGGTGHIDAAEAAAGLIARLDALTLETTGTFVHQNGQTLPW